MTTGWFSRILAIRIFPLNFSVAPRVWSRTGFLQIVWYNLRSPAGRRRKNSMIPHKVEARRRHQCRELLDELERFEQHMRGSVTPFVPETIRHTAVGVNGQSLNPKTFLYYQCVEDHFETKGLEEVFRYKVFKMLRSKGKITEDLVAMLMGWRHSGFNVFGGHRIQPGDDTAMENVARYIIRASFSQEKMTREYLSV